MYAVAGLIQTLLMLTQAQFMPDLSGFWEELSQPPTAKPLQYGTVLCNGSTIVFYEGTAAEMLLNRDADLSPTNIEEESKKYNSPRHTLPDGRVITEKKLYLIFCQLRIGG